MGREIKLVDMSGATATKATLDKGITPLYNREPKNDFVTLEDYNFFEANKKYIIIGSIVWVALIVGIIFYFKKTKK